MPDTLERLTEETMGKTENDVAKGTLDRSEDRKTQAKKAKTIEKEATTGSRLRTRRNKLQMATQKRRRPINAHYVRKYAKCKNRKTTDNTNQIAWNNS